MVIGTSSTRNKCLTMCRRVRQTAPGSESTVEIVPSFGAGVRFWRRLAGVYRRLHVCLDPRAGHARATTRNIIGLAGPSEVPLTPCGIDHRLSLGCGLTLFLFFVFFPRHWAVVVSVFPPVLSLRFTGVTELFTGPVQDHALPKIVGHWPLLENASVGR